MDAARLPLFLVGNSGDDSPGRGAHNDSASGADSPLLDTEHPEYSRISAIRSNDLSIARQEFDALYKELYPPLLDFAFRYVKSRDIAHDVIQEVFVSLWLRRKMWAPRGSIVAYLYGATRIRAMDVSARNKSLHSIETQSEHGQPAELPEDPTERAQRGSALRRAIDVLPDRQRDAILLCYGRGLSVADAARTLGISHTAATNLITRALARLRETVSPEN